MAARLQAQKSPGPPPFLDEGDEWTIGSSDERQLVLSDSVFFAQGALLKKDPDGSTLLFTGDIETTTNPYSKSAASFPAILSHLKRLPFV